MVANQLHDWAPKKLIEFSITNDLKVTQPFLSYNLFVIEIIIIFLPNGNKKMDLDEFLEPIKCTPPCSISVNIVLSEHSSHSVSWIYPLSIQTSF